MNVEVIDVEDTPDVELDENNNNNNTDKVVTFPPISIDDSSDSESEDEIEYDSDVPSLGDIVNSDSDEEVNSITLAEQSILKKLSLHKMFAAIEAISKKAR